MICHWDGVIVSEAYNGRDMKLLYLETVIPELSIDNTYKLYYIEGVEKTLIGDIMRKHIYCRDSRKLIFSSYTGELFAYSDVRDQPQRLAFGCEDFIASPDGSVILYTSQNKIWLRTPNGEETLVKSRCKDVVLLSVSNDATLLVWGRNNKQGNLVTCRSLQNGHQKSHSFPFVEAPRIISNRTGKELVFFDNRSVRRYQDDSYLFSYSPESGFRRILQLHRILAVSGYDSLQVNGATQALDTDSLNGLILTYYNHCEQGVEDDRCCVDIYQNGRCNEIACYHFVPYYYSRGGREYMIGTYYSTGGIIYWAELKDRIPVRSWWVSPDRQREEDWRIRLSDLKNPTVWFYMGKGVDDVRLYPIDVLEKGMQHLLDNNQGSQQERVLFLNRMEWLATQAFSTIQAEILPGGLDVYGIPFHYEEGIYACYLSDTTDIAQTLTIQSLRGKETLRFTGMSRICFTRCVDGSFYFFTLHTPDSKDDSECDLWYFDAERWRAVKCVECVEWFSMVEPHRWEDAVGTRW